MSAIRFSILLWFVFLSSLLRINAQDLLTIEETIELAKKTYFDHVPIEDIEKSKRANPAARPYLYAILNDTSQKIFWPQVLGSFAYLGQDEDVATLEKFVRGRKGIVQTDEYRAVSMFFTVLGEMGNRGIDKARQLHKTMLMPEYWEKMNFSVDKNIPAESPEFKSTMTMIALRGYAYADDPDFEKVADSVYKRISGIVNNEERKKIFRNNLDNIKQFNRQVRQQKIRGN